MKCRLDKLLSTQGFGSRRDIKRQLKDLDFTRNGTIVTDPGTIVDIECDIIAFRGQKLQLRQKVYLMLNKKAGFVSSTDDPEHETVIDALGAPWSSMDLFPVGRLDRDTEGLLLITNDGPLTHALTSPKRGVDKEYYVRLRDPLEDDALAEYAERAAGGLTFHDGYTTLPARIERHCGEAAGIRITIQEGKYHQVKKMCKVLGNEVAYLKRIAMGGLRLDDSLTPGSFRELTEEEVAMLYRETGLHHGN